VAELTWNTWRDHLVLEYEIPKYEGDLHTPDLYVPVDRAVVDRKIEILLSSYASQRSRAWFDAETFRGLMRIRGVECGSPTGYAEGFHAPKMVLTADRA
jgi:LmbE family N-acetylglucosaminyl deacetylase